MPSCFRLSTHYLSRHQKSSRLNACCSWFSRSCPLAIPYSTYALYVFLLLSTSDWVFLALFFNIYPTFLSLPSSLLVSCFLLSRMAVANRTGRLVFSGLRLRLIGPEMQKRGMAKYVINANPNSLPVVQATNKENRGPSQELKSYVRLNSRSTSTAILTSPNVKHGQFIPDVLPDQTTALP
jgi:hypothetical protein